MAVSGILTNDNSLCMGNTIPQHLVGKVAEHQAAAAGLGFKGRDKPQDI